MSSHILIWPKSTQFVEDSCSPWKILENRANSYSPNQLLLVRNHSVTNPFPQIPQQ